MLAEEVYMTFRVTGLKTGHYRMGRTRVVAGNSLAEKA